jgi:hypothetical protein
MIKLLTIFNLLAGGASIAGLYVSVTGPADPRVTYALVGVFGVALALSAYVLLIPGTQLEQNVGSKLLRYRAPSSVGPDADLVIQRGEFTISGWGPVAIEFHEPFVVPPRVEVINYRGYTTVTPSVVQLTEQHAVFKRENPLAPGQAENYRWAARGICLEKR